VPFILGYQNFILPIKPLCLHKICEQDTAAKRKYVTLVIHQKLKELAGLKVVKAEV
jgi:hypothetical protein